jgi:predicted nucleotidyltransferase
MTIVAERTVPAAAHRVAAALGEEPAAVYLLGSVALGAFEPGTSDLDMVAVFDPPLGRREKEALVERVLEVDLAPARQLELVAYAGGEVILNLNTDPLRVEDTPAPEEWFWFVLDRAIAQEHALALSGPPWRELFDDVSRPQALAALEASLDWHERHEPASGNAVLNAVRGWRWVETGDWVSKPEAARWLLGRVREEVRS